MKYTYLIDCGELLTESKEFANDGQALAYGKELFDSCNAPYITVVDGKGNKIGEFEV
jgi:hypothetical protein